MPRFAKDMTGKRSGLLKIMFKTKRVNSRWRWACKCDCGNFHIVSQSDLTTGNVKSCGCNRGGASKFARRLKTG